MRKYRFGSLCLALCLLLAVCVFGACGQMQGGQEATAAPDGALVYYVSSDGTKLLTATSNTEGQDDAALRELFATLRDGDFPEGYSAIPADLQLDHTAWQEDCLVLYLKGSYPEAGTAEETFCRAALVKTLLPVAEAESMMINLEEEPLKEKDGTEVGIIRQDSFVMNLTDQDGEKRKTSYTLYFANMAGSALVREVREAEVGEYESDAAAVLDNLIRGTAMEGHVNVIPSGTTVLGVNVRDRICYVNFNESFRSQVLEIPELLTVYAVVNTLTELDDVDQVQITVDGVADVTLGQDVSLAAPLAAREDLVEE